MLNRLHISTLPSFEGVDAIQCDECKQKMHVALIHAKNSPGISDLFSPVEKLESRIPVVWLL